MAILRRLSERIFGKRPEPIKKIEFPQRDERGRFTDSTKREQIAKGKRKQ